MLTLLSAPVSMGRCGSRKRCHFKAVLYGQTALLTQAAPSKIVIAKLSIVGFWHIKATIRVNVVEVGTQQWQNDDTGDIDWRRDRCEI